MRRYRASRRRRRERSENRGELRHALLRGIVQGEHQHRGSFSHSSQKDTGTTGSSSKTYSRLLCYYKKTFPLYFSRKIYPSVEKNSNRYMILKVNLIYVLIFFLNVHKKMRRNSNRIFFFYFLLWFFYSISYQNGTELSLRYNEKFLQASLFEASEREGADSIIKAQSPSQQGDAWRCTC